MEKKRILFAMHYLEIGGAETALIGLLGAIDYSKVDVDLFLYSHRGEMMAFVPKEVNLLPEIPAYAQIERPLKDVLKDGFFKIAAARLKAKLQTGRYLRRRKVADSAAGLQYLADAVSPLLPAINPGVEYDLAVSFLHPHNIVRDKVRAKKKACWIHTDYSKVDINAARELPVWASFDHIVSISDAVTKTFLQTFPPLSGKIVQIENILSEPLVRKRSEEFDATSFMPASGQVKLLSVGRFSHAKNYDNVPDICRRIVAAGVQDFKWYIIGYGPDEQLIKSKIAEAGMESKVILLGKQINPYPFIKACDIYVQPSRYEGNSVTVREAQMLCKPVVVTAYPTAHSQINDGTDGVIVPMDNQGCSGAIASLVKDKARQEAISQHLAAHHYGNEKAVERFYELVQG